MSNASNLVCVLSSFLFAFAAFPTPAAAEEGTALLFRGAETGEVALPQQVLPGADPNLRDGTGRTALMIAAQEGHFDAVRFLLWQSADANLAGDSGNTSVVMSKTGRPPRRQIRLGYNQTHLQAAMEEGFAITAICGWQDHWDIILTEETAYGRQRFSLPAAFGEERKEWIAGRMSEGYRITLVAGDETGEGKDGSWLVVMTLDSGLGDQVHHGVGPWPEDWIEARHGEGYRITATAGYKENWVVVMSRGTDLDEQTVQVSGEFPTGWIATQWGE